MLPEDGAENISRKIFVDFKKALMVWVGALVLSTVCSTIDIYRQTAKEFVNFVLSGCGGMDNRL